MLHPNPKRMALHSMTKELKRENMDRLKRMADRIAFLIVATDYPEIDLILEEEKLREECARLFPDRMDLFEMIYGARFQRLKEQFRSQQ